jgi:rare lipoprotein A
MRTKLSFGWAGIRWLLLMFVITQAVKAPAVERPEPPKPLRVWTGVSSWYGPKFHGRVTANGEIYNMYAPTAAHPTLPLGSLVRLVNPNNGKSRVVRINDRGPVKPGREIDVSYAVARSLGFQERGLAKVRIELLEVPKRLAPEAPKLARAESAIQSPDRRP